MKHALALLAGGIFVSASLAQETPDPWATDAQGWTVLPDFVNQPPFPGTQYCVSVSGSDASTNPHDPATPLQTIAEAHRRMSPGDCLFIRCGETFLYSFTQNLPGGTWALSGQSLFAPTVITTYTDALSGTARPIFTCLDTNGLDLNTTVHDVRFVGLDLVATRSTASVEPYGISLVASAGTSPSQHVLFEDFRVAEFFQGVRFQSDAVQPHQDIRLRRSLVVDSFTNYNPPRPDTPHHSEGLYAQYVDTLLIEECLFDHNGWNPTQGAWATQFRHNVYIQGTCANVTLRGNIVANGGAHGIMCRPGGDIRYNLLLRNPVNMIIGDSPTLYGTPVGGVTATVIGNVMIDGADIQTSGAPPPPPVLDRRGWAMVLQHLASGDIHHNICAWNLSPYTDSNSNRISYQFNGSVTNQMVGINRADFNHNISYDWRAPILFDGSAFGNQGYPTAGLWLHINDIQELTVPVEVIKAINGLPPLRSPSPPGPGGLVSDNNRVWTSLQPPPPSDVWFLWPGPTSLSAWSALVGEQSPNLSTAVSVAYGIDPSTGWPATDGQFPPLPVPSSPAGVMPSIEWFLQQCRLQSKQSWDPRLVASPPATGPTTPPTNLVHRYGRVFNLCNSSGFCNY